MAHFACKKFPAFLSLLSTGDVNEYAKHDPLDHPGIVALSASRDPSQLVSDHDPEIDLIGADDRAGGGEGGGRLGAVGARGDGADLDG